MNDFPPDIAAKAGASFAGAMVKCLLEYSTWERIQWNLVAATLLTGTVLGTFNTGMVLKPLGMDEMAAWAGAAFVTGFLGLDFIIWLGAKAKQVFGSKQP